jgi:hypothetical protein
VIRIVHAHQLFPLRFDGYARPDNTRWRAQLRRAMEGLVDGRIPRAHPQRGLDAVRSSDTLSHSGREAIFR